MILILLALGAITGCTKKAPGGQVVAVVDGQEVTRRDLAAEPQFATTPDGQGAQAGVNAVLNGVIDRKLAAAEAKHLELDRTPRYVEQAKRLDEVMLSRTLFDRWAAEMPPPDQRRIAGYIVHNPQRFAARKLFLVDRIQTKMDQGQSDALTPFATNDAVAAYLDSRSQAYRRDRTVIDSAQVPLPLYRELLSLEPGDPLVLMQPEGASVLAIVETRDAPLPAGEQTAEAIKALKQVEVQQRLAALRKNATIAYQPGYRPADEASASRPATQRQAAR
jgi:EpsD family peptidyl-prolyl cis-trans isomerase